jgi:hypothetical protein
MVDLSRSNATTGYTEQQAVEDLRQRGDKIIVQITLVFRAAYGSSPNKSQDNGPPQDTQGATLRPENFWQSFRFSVKQRGKIVASRSLHNKPIYSAATKDAPSTLDGATVWLEYDAKDVASENTVVEVVTPEVKTISASFDLKKLR